MMKITNKAWELKSQENYSLWDDLRLSNLLFKKLLKLLKIQAVQRNKKEMWYLILARKLIKL